MCARTQTPLHKIETKSPFWRECAAGSRYPKLFFLQGLVWLILSFGLLGVESFVRKFFLPSKPLQKPPFDDRPKPPQLPKPPILNFKTFTVTQETVIFGLHTGEGWRHGTDMPCRSTCSGKDALSHRRIYSACQPPTQKTSLTSVELSHVQKVKDTWVSID